MTPPKPSSNPFMGGMPGMPIGNIFDGKQQGNFNVDDIVKRIDARIAELEAEEQAEKAKQAKASKKSSESSVENSKLIEERKFKREEITDV